MDETTETQLTIISDPVNEEVFASIEADVTDLLTIINEDELDQSIAEMLDLSDVEEAT